MTKPVTIEDFEDGRLYEVERLKFRTTHLYMEISIIGELVYKKPSRVGAEDFQKFIEFEEYDDEMIRPLETLEKSSNSAELIKKYPSIYRLSQSSNASWVRWLLIHKLQNDRIANNGIVSVPQCRFVVINVKRGIFASRSTPAIVQNRIHGTSVWDMRDHNRRSWKSNWQGALQEIGKRLVELVNSPLRDHINWNIANFILSEDDNELYYVDCTPSAIFARAENEQNIKSILRDFSEPCHLS